jgi:hypothetical protein
MTPTQQSSIERLIAALHAMPQDVSMVLTDGQLYFFDGPIPRMPVVVTGHYITHSALVRCEAIDFSKAVVQASVRIESAEESP